MFYQFLKTIYNSFVLMYFRKEIKKYKIKKYRSYIPCILNRVSQQKKINVVFFVINTSMWKYDGLFQLLLIDERYNPIIVSCLGYSANEDVRIYEQQKMKDYFIEKGFPFLEGYNVQKQKWNDIKKYKPDLIFYTQPYNKNPYKGYNIENFYKYSLFAYIPYGFWVEKWDWGYDLLFHNIAWRLFYSTNIHLQHAINYSYIKGINVSVVGYPMADRFLNSSKSTYLWKIDNPKLKRVIWAPHHSITKGLLENSTFLDIAEDMLQLADRYSDKVQFAFKPHPTLKNKLYKLKEWGIEKTDHYFKCWENASNAIFADSDYVDLFLTSDAMIHDCGSFSAEYLYTKHPVMFIAKSNHLDYLCDFGKKCLEVHYNGYNIHDIECFLNRVVIDGDDVMKDSRYSFFNHYLAKKDKTVSEKIFNEINKLLNRHGN